MFDLIFPNRSENSQRRYFHTEIHLHYLETMRWKTPLKVCEHASMRR